jgi:hypothetical protein
MKREFGEAAQAVPEDLSSLLDHKTENNATYIKIQHAPIILQEIGLPKIRKKCRGFNAWLAQLESL